MKRSAYKGGVGFLTGILLLLLLGIGLWVRMEQKQYARNRQLIDCLIRDDTKTALALVEAGADPNTRLTPLPMPNPKQLLIHSLRPTPPTVNNSPTAFLIACGAERSLNPPTTFGGDPPLREDMFLLQAMLRRGADIRTYTRRWKGDWTALQYAAFNERPQTAKLLLQNGAEVNVQDAWGDTPLMMARSYGGAMPPLSPLLLAYGANPSVQDITGRTVLHQAVSDHAIPYIELLLAHGADPNIVDKRGETPLSYARFGRQSDIVVLLQRSRK